MTRVTFVEKGGKPIRHFPFYTILANVPPHREGLKDWYRHGDFIKIPVEEFDMTAVSFTYGDQCQTVDPREYENFKINKYRPQVYTYDGILGIIKTRGWIPFIGTNDWRRPWYIEAQVWSGDNTIGKYRKSYQRY